MLLRRQAVDAAAGGPQRPGGPARPRRPGWAWRRGSRPTRRRSSRSCGGRQRGRPGGLLGHHLPADRGGERGVLALPGTGRGHRTTGRTSAACTPARRGSSSTGSPPTTGGPGSSPVAHRPAAEEPDDEYPVLLTTGRVRRPVPVRGADPAGRRAERRRARARSSSCTRGWPSGSASARASRWRWCRRRGRAVAPARITDRDPPGHGLHAVPLAGRGPRQHADQSGAGPDLPDAGVQGVRGPGGGRTTLRGKRVGVRVTR